MVVWVFGRRFGRVLKKKGYDRYMSTLKQKASITFVFRAVVENLIELHVGSFSSGSARKKEKAGPFPA
jgi:hypothetical protein